MSSSGDGPKENADYALVDLDAFDVSIVGVLADGRGRRQRQLEFNVYRTLLAQYSALGRPVPKDRLIFEAARFIQDNERLEEAPRSVEERPSGGTAVRVLGWLGRVSQGRSG